MNNTLSFTNHLCPIVLILNKNRLPKMLMIFLQVQISKKGVYAPGTRNRLVTIKGTQVQYIMDSIF